MEKLMAEAGTQTLAPYACRRCEVEESADTDGEDEAEMTSRNSGPSYSREELLRVGKAIEAAEKVHADEA
jgi:hypothetical protein